MTVVTKEQIIKSVPDRWHHQYVKYYNKRLADGKSSEEIYERLISCDLTEETVAEIIGNKTWTNNICSECGKDQEITVVFGDDPINVCLPCLNQAILLCDKVENK